MPELPEVEVVCRGLQRWAVGRTVADVEVRHDRAVRRHPGGAADLAGRLRGRRLLAASRRGKYLWLALPGEQALVAHLGMSGQLLVVPDDRPPERHLRVRLRFADEGPEVRFVDQRTFGGLALEDLVPAGSGRVPASVAHIARDPLDPQFDAAAFVTGLRRRRTGLKRALLDQTLVSGIGNIYADEALWRSRRHWATATDTLPAAAAREVLAAARAVMTEALAEGGTSFDAMYVNVNGDSGYFSRRLAVYGRGGQPCPRCGTPVRRERFMNRSSFRCPRCQRTPRRPHW